jgi:hypothetical protein
VHIVILTNSTQFKCARSLYKSFVTTLSLIRLAEQLHIVHVFFIATQARRGKIETLCVWYDTIARINSLKIRDRSFTWKPRGPCGTYEAKKGKSCHNHKKQSTKARNLHDVNYLQSGSNNLQYQIWPFFLNKEAENMKKETSFSKQKMAYMVWFITLLFNFTYQHFFRCYLVCRI